MKLASTRPRTRRNYGVASNPFYPERASATRTVIAAGVGSIVPGFAGWALGLVLPGISAVKFGTAGALLGASLSAYKSLQAQGAISDS